MGVLAGKTASISRPWLNFAIRNGFGAACRKSVAGVERNKRAACLTITNCLAYTERSRQASATIAAAAVTAQRLEGARSAVRQRTVATQSAAPHSTTRSRYSGRSVSRVECPKPSAMAGISVTENHASATPTAAIPAAQTARRARVCPGDRPCERSMESRPRPARNAALKKNAIERRSMREN